MPTTCSSSPTQTSLNRLRCGESAQRVQHRPEPARDTRAPHRHAARAPRASVRPIVPDRRMREHDGGDVGVIELCVGLPAEQAIHQRVARRRSPPASARRAGDVADRVHARRRWCSGTRRPATCPRGSHRHADVLPGRAVAGRTAPGREHQRVETFAVAAASRRAARTARPHRAAPTATRSRNACGCRAGAGPRPVAWSGPRRNFPAAGACARTGRHGCRAPAARRRVRPRCSRAPTIATRSGASHRWKKPSESMPSSAPGISGRCGRPPVAMRMLRRAQPHAIAAFDRVARRPAGRAAAAMRCRPCRAAAGSWHGCWRCSAADGRRTPSSPARAARRASKAQRLRHRHPVREIGGQPHRLLRHAADIDAGAAERALGDQRDPRAVACGAERGSEAAGSRAEDDEIEIRAAAGGHPKRSRR